MTNITKFDPVIIWSGILEGSDFKVTERSAPVALTMAGSNDKNPMTR